MTKTGITDIWQPGKTVLNGWLSLPCSFAAEAMAELGWDTLTVDLQHGLIDYQTAVTMAQAISISGKPALTRTPSLEPGIVGKLLDIGFSGVICPMVNSAEEARALVEACKYPPLGSRSFGPIRALTRFGSDYGEKANRETLAIAMIETGEAVENMPEILAVEGVDAVFVGPSDLAMSIGAQPSLTPDDPAVLDLIKRIADQANKFGIRAGIHTGSAAFAHKMCQTGYSLVTILNDNRLLAAGAHQVIGEFRDGASPGGASDQPTGPTSY